MSEAKGTGEYSKRLLLSRMRVLTTHPFFGLLLMHMKFGLNETVETAATDGMQIYFSPKFLDFLSDGELDFVLMHEIMHVALQHCTRGKEYDNFIFNIACDIVVNSNILRANGMKKESITLRAFGESMHITPKGDEGFLYTAEEVYNMLLDKNGGKKSSGGNGGGSGNKGASTGEKNGNGSSHGKNKTDSSASACEGETACDRYSGEISVSDIKDRLKEKNGTAAIWDDHSAWGSIKDKELPAVLLKRATDAATAVRIQDPTNSRGLMPLCAERFFGELRGAENDWRTILASFIDEEICDYSFSPPDRRYDGSDFFLPDYNDTEERVDNILFMIDTSGSMSDIMISDCYAEIGGAIEQFDGHLMGWLGFFDAEVVEPVRFDTIEEFSIIRPKGGGGTRFDIIFDYVREKMQNEPPVSIIILTDGYAPFPEEDEAMGIPVLWVINNQNIKPPFGRVARIS